MAAPKLSIEQLKNSPQWVRCSRQQQLFLDEYLSSGLGQGMYDAPASCRAAYPHVKAVKIWASRLMTNKHIRAVIALYFGWSETEVILSEVKALLKRSRRRGAHLDNLVAPWLRLAASLEVLIAQEKTNDH